jgi:hypothetical protein
MVDQVQACVYARITSFRVTYATGTVLCAKRRFPTPKKAGPTGRQIGNVVSPPSLGGSVMLVACRFAVLSFSEVSETLSLDVRRLPVRECHPAIVEDVYLLRP